MTNVPPRACIGLVEQIVRAMSNPRALDAANETVMAAVRSAHAALSEISTELGLDSFQLTVTGETLSFQNRATLPTAATTVRLVEILKWCGASALALRSIATPTEILQLCRTLRESRQNGRRNVGEINRELVNARVKNAKLLAGSVARPAAQKPDAQRPAARPTPQSAAQQPPQAQAPAQKPRALQGEPLTAALQDSARNVAGGGRIDFATIRHAVDLSLRAMEKNAVPAFDLGHEKRHDPWSIVHAARTTALTLHVARSLTKDRAIVLRLGTAALLHDIGKVLLPREIVEAKTALDEHQTRLMRQHPQLGAELLLGHNEADPTTIAVALGHHLKPGAGGYPHMLHDPETSLFTDLVRICDVYESMTAWRPWSPAVSPVRAYRTMISKRHEFQPALLRQFVEINGIYPCGSAVELTNGEQGIVLHQSPRYEAPIVLVRHDAAGHPLPDPYTIDLSRPSTAGRVAIVPPRTRSTARR